jgi:hypothetical protein
MSGPSSAQALGLGPAGWYDFAGAGCAANGHTDPIGVLFRGKQAYAANVHDHIERHSNWDQGGKADHYLWVLTAGGDYDCRKTNIHNASHAEGPFDRNHIRLWFIPASGPSEYKTVGTPHYDEYVFLNDCGVGHSVPESMLIPDWDKDGLTTHESGFDYSKLLLKYKFEWAGHPVAAEWWGNTARFNQCDGDESGSNGVGFHIWVHQKKGDPPKTSKASSSGTGATLQGTVYPEEGMPTEWWFSYGPYPSQGASGYPYKTEVKSTWSEAQLNVSEVISGLSPKTAYYVRLFARIDGETLEGNEEAFGAPPTVTTGSATAVKEFQADVSGTVDPEGLPTDYWFEYGTTSSYGHSIPIAHADAGSGSSPVAVSETIDRLEPGQTYHVRIVATNVTGTSYGADQTFHTLGWRFMRGLSSGTGVSSWSSAVTMDVPFMAVGDFDADDEDDVVSVEGEGNGLYRYKLGASNGSGVSGWGQILSGMSIPVRLGLADFSGDGKADIVAVEKQSNGQYRYKVGYSTGTGISSWDTELSDMSYPHKMAVADFSGDGKADIVAVEKQSNGQYRYKVGYSTGTGISSWDTELSNMSYAEFMDLGDVNADGKADIAAVESEGGGEYRFKFGISSGSGVSSWNQVMSEMSGPYFFYAGDIDGDGNADIVSLEEM